MTGKHEPYVKHPYDMNPKWVSYSPTLQAKRYAKYEEYVENWHAANGSKPSKSIWSSSTEEDDAYWDNLVADPAHYEKWKAAQMKQ
ncbi:hypothetical protein [Mesorhizobium sp. IMUNJ 23232]|uniref:hypothetical protein n=1 Tax=Mesorhizobium sp. IMUNJ 23232 TaxID=3376064 RepID=UPI0037A3EB5D